jgi:regulator of protease activity HflC (stomatin/prohibitin superfamily)
MDLSLGYEVILLPALWLASGVTAIVFFLRGFTRTPLEVDGVEIGKLAYNWRTGIKGAMVIGVALAILPAVVVTPPGHRAVIYHAAGGVQMDERPEGVSFILPYINTAKQMDVREQLYFSEQVFAQSEDLQEITVHLAVGYLVRPSEAAEIYQDVGMDYARILIEPEAQDSAKTAIGQVLAEDFAISRAALGSAIVADIQAAVDRRGLEITYVAIVDAVFDPDFIASVKDKVIADQEAAEQLRLVEAERARKQQVEQRALAEELKRAIEARGESEAIAQIADALGFTSEEYLQWVFFQTWDGGMPDTLVGGDADQFILDVTPNG